MIQADKVLKRFLLIFPAVVVMYPLAEIYFRF